MPYVVTEPDAIRGVYETWTDCGAAISGVPGAVFRRSRLAKKPKPCSWAQVWCWRPASFAFTDGNDKGGVGVVIVQVGEEEGGVPQTLREVATSARQVFRGASISGLESDQAVHDALGGLRNILAELGGLYAAIALLPQSSRATIVHDYAGVGAWMQGTWRIKNLIVQEIISASLKLARRRGLELGSGTPG